MIEIAKGRDGSVGVPKAVPPNMVMGALLFTLAVSALLTAGFLPTSAEIWELIALPLWRRVGGGVGVRVNDAGLALTFPVLAFLFFRSLGKKNTEPGLQAPSRNPWAVSLLPFSIALIYGVCHERTHLLTPLGRGNGLNALQIFLLIPIGEEFLFRGWVYALVEKIYGAKFASATNPLPLAVWMSAVAFSLWHLQNGSPWATLFFQVGYTFFIGLWLGYLRWLTKSLSFPIAAHVLVNVLAG